MQTCACLIRQLGESVNLGQTNLKKIFLYRKIAFQLWNLFLEGQSLDYLTTRLTWLQNRKLYCVEVLCMYDAERWRRYLPSLPDLLSRSFLIYDVKLSTPDSVWALGTSSPCFSFVRFSGHEYIFKEKLNGI